MAVYRAKDKPHGRPRTKPWCCDWYVGSKKKRKFFKTKAEATEHEAKQTLAPVARSDLGKVRCSDLVERYIKEVTSQRSEKSIGPETSMLRTFLDQEPGSVIADKKLADLDEDVDFWFWHDARIKQVKASTVSRERGVLQRVFAVARQKWGYKHLINPFKGKKIEGSKFKRTRRLEDGEYERLIAATRTCRTRQNQRFIPVAINLAIETAGRAQEVFGLTWEDVNLEKRTVTIRKSKTDKKQDIPGRTIVMTWKALEILVRLSLDAQGERKAMKGPIIPGTQISNIRAFERAVERVGLEDFVFHDLRHEAGSRWAEMEPVLSPAQHKFMMGHATSSSDISDTYIHVTMDLIRDKLDRQRVGKTFEEHYGADFRKFGNFECVRRSIILGRMAAEDLQKQIEAKEGAIRFPLQPWETGEDMEPEEAS